MKRFFNENNQIVTQAIDGSLCLADARHLSRADAYPAIKFVYRNDFDSSKVAVISGGGAGHEPAHIGFVGKGMLTAAVSGEVFASPSVEAVLTCILHVAGEGGCLLIVKNYTGDRLNFGLAAEKAKKMGVKVEMIVVADDIALPDAIQPRGIAGTLFVHKVAGYAAEAGKSLAEVKVLAMTASQNVYSLGIALSTCILPGQEIVDRHENAELGLGIHGEPGLEKVIFDDGKEGVRIVLSRLFAQTEPEATYAILINNLGSITPLEMAIITDEILNSSYRAQIKLVVGPALMMTSLNMYGFSLSIIKLTDEIEHILREPVEPLAWPGVVEPVKPQISDVSYLNLRKEFTPSKNPKVQDLLYRICTGLIHAEKTLNELDKKVGDGDTGTTFKSGAQAILNCLEAQSLPLDHTADLLVALGEQLSVHMGGSSGVLSSILLTNAGIKIEQGASLPNALESGINQMMVYGGARLGSRTMIDALLPAVQALESGDVEAATLAAKKGAAATAKMESAESGRSSYLRSDSLLDVVDPGAKAISIIFESISV